MYVKSFKIFWKSKYDILVIGITPVFFKASVTSIFFLIYKQLRYLIIKFLPRDVKRKTWLEQSVKDKQFWFVKNYSN